MDSINGLWATILTIAYKLQHPMKYYSWNKVQNFVKLQNAFTFNHQSYKYGFNDQFKKKIKFMFLLASFAFEVY
jgi:hypothetical protein